MYSIAFLNILIIVITIELLGSCPINKIFCITFFIIIFDLNSLLPLLPLNILNYRN